jgi:FHA domain/Domain of unknown function (DUF1707)
VLGEAPTPLPLRASDVERERALSALQAGSREGRLSLDTFSGRVVRALSARSRVQLDELVRDLPARRGPLRLVSAAVAAVSAPTAEIASAWREPRVARLVLPRSRAMLTIGRASDCDCVLADETVSRHHARLRRSGPGWLLLDLDSTNGTRLNGRRLVEEIEVRAGDRVSFGTARYRLTHD